MFHRVIPAAADAALGTDAHAAAAANKSKAGGGRGSFAAKFAKIHEKVRARNRANVRIAHAGNCTAVCAVEDVSNAPARILPR